MNPRLAEGMRVEAMKATAARAERIEAKLDRILAHLGLDAEGDAKAAPAQTSRPASRPAPAR